LNARRDRRRRVESFQATIAGRYWEILRLRESRNKSVVVLFIEMNVALTLEARLAMGSSKVRGVQKRARVGGGAGTGIHHLHTLAHRVESAC
jgi:hypothetical protein